MDATNLRLAHELVPATYIEQGGSELRRRQGLVRVLLTQRTIPDVGWDEPAIEHFLRELATMDSNNFTGAVGAGEREGRVFSGLVWRRHFGFGHGIGRSGDIAAVQPKAAGSSLLYKLTNRLALHAAQLCGLTRAEAALVLPAATGMSLALVLLTLRASRRVGASYVIWSRIDQKSCFKALMTAGCEPVIIELVKREGEDELRTDVGAIEEAVRRLGPDACVAVITTTSCFAPRACDDVSAIAKICK
jgi:O-phospho-L-seryl-tRNASec:L-selenocysteinyl-tRNA synthase